MQHAGRLQLDLHLAEVGDGRIRAIERAIRRSRSGPSDQENADSRRCGKSILSAHTALRRYCNRQGERSAQVLSAAVVHSVVISVWQRLRCTATSEMGQSLQIDDLQAMSASPPIAVELMHRREW